MFDADHRLIAKPVDLAAPQAQVDRIGELHELRVTWTAMPSIDKVMRSIDEYLEHIEAWATEVIAPYRGESTGPPFRDLTGRR